MSVIARVGGEVAGISGGDLQTEGFQGGGSLVVLPAGAFAGFTPRTAPNGLGGSYFVGNSSSVSLQGGDLNHQYDPQEFWGFIALQRAAHVGGDMAFRFRQTSVTANTQTHITIAVDGTTGTIEIYSVGLSLRDTSTEVIPVGDNVFTGLWFHIRCADAGGFIHVYLSDPNGGASPVATYTGDTKHGGFVATMGKTRIEMWPGNAMDDLRFQSASILYTGGSGTWPTVSTNLTIKDALGNVLGTAVVDHREGDVANGRFHLRDVYDSTGLVKWDGLKSSDPFAGAATVEAGGVWSATVVGGAMEPTSGFPLDAYQVAISPDAAGSLSQLTSSSGGSNYANVDDGVDTGSESDYNSTATPGDADLYGMEDPPAAALINYGDALAVYARVQEVGGSGVNNTAGLLKLSGNELEGFEQAIPSGGAAVQRFEFTTDPLGNVGFSRSNVQGTEIGARMKG